jgi:two-component system nitrogen regulation sensor histidine kinase GlnL
VVANPVLLVRQPGLRVIYANPAAEASFAVSRKAMVELSLPDLFGASEELDSMFETVMARQVDVRRQDLVLRPPLQEPMHAHVVIGGVEGYANTAVVEVLLNEQKVRSDREERILDLTSANKELIRNLAHEIKNPLGGIRGAAQLLEFELPERALREYTQVIIRSRTACKRWWTACWSRIVIRTSSRTSISTRCWSVCARWCWPSFRTGWKSCATTMPACPNCAATWSN